MVARKVVISIRVWRVRRAREVKPKVIAIIKVRIIIRVQRFETVSAVKQQVLTDIEVLIILTEEWEK